ncbi:MAG: hydantoinase/oxoprolinase family protein, partial [Verrucomicrobiae bacterium]|nr:hydantoinase/oxoprolinase family protein [Verrucomicrobiae bacterium]
MATPWQISVDTGGTFTDCYGIPPGSTDHEAQLVKVLSSGRLRISVQEAIDDRTFRLAIPHGWQTPEGFFVGFDAEIAGKRNPVMAWENATKILHLRDPSALGEVIELHASEEAPVVGARLLTGTGLAEAFPPLTFRLGTTRGTNALLERKGAPTALFITRGFGDLLTIRDQRRPDLFALAHHQPPPLFERVIEIDERLDAEGNLLTPLATTFEDAARRALADGISVAAVALMHSYRNPAHEEELRARLLALGFDHVSLSAELAPLIKILPRAETAVVDATLTPVMQQFTQKIRSALGETRPLLIMTSAGGLEPAQTFRPKDSLLSGPAGGVVGAAAAARELGFDRILTFDMGGTSTDVARVDGDFHYRFEQKVGDARLLAPALSIETVASGGGSLCQWTEAGLRVGPESAGSDPGPACYGRGGPLTMTDVNLLLGRIDPDNFGIPIGAENLDAARRALTDLAAQVPGTSESALLEGVLAISTEQMADAIRTISIREGADPADYALVAFGGAGPLHACDIAEKLGIRSVIVPREAGLLSAYGIHHAVVERFAERQVLAPLHAIENTLEETLNALACEARDQLRQDLSDHAKIIIRRRLAEVRLMGQDATMTVEIESPSDIGARFRRQYAEV